MNEEELNPQLNALYQQTVMQAYSYGNLFANGLFNAGIIKDVTPEELQKYFSKPDVFQDVIYDIAQYYYIINAEIHQLFENIESLPKLTYSISAFEREGTEDKNIIKLKRNMHRIEHKRFARDLLKQTAAYGNVAGVWLGKAHSEEVYPYIFDDFRYVKEAFRTVNGKWQLVISAQLFYDKCGYEKLTLMNEFKTILTPKQYRQLVAEELEDFLLPLERTIYTGTGKLNRNQFKGTSWITPVMLDTLHKRKLKDVEQTVANKILNAVAVLTMGSFDGKDKENNGGNLVRDYNMLPDKLVKGIHAQVKNAISNGNTEGMALVTIPNFAKLEFPKITSDGLDGEKFNQTNSDITKGIGLSTTIMNGEGANYNSAKLNLEIFYMKLAVLLEDVESVLQLFFDLTLSKSHKGKYYITYNKDMPISAKDRLQHLKGLYDKGWSARTYIQELGYDFDVMYQETQEELNMNINKELVPPPTSYTQSASAQQESEENGRPPVDDSDAEEQTIRTRETQGN